MYGNLLSEASFQNFENINKLASQSLRFNF